MHIRRTNDYLLAIHYDAIFVFFPWRILSKHLFFATRDTRDHPPTRLETVE
jgi:hypothetical protein